MTKLQEKLKKKSELLFFIIAIVVLSIAAIISTVIVLTADNDKNTMSKETIAETEKTTTSEIVFEEITTPNEETTIIEDAIETTMYEEITTVYEEPTVCEETTTYYETEPIPVETVSTTNLNWYYNDTLPFSVEFKQYIDTICNEYNVSPSLLYALIETESNFEPNVISSGNDYGLCQINAINFSYLSNKLNIDVYSEILNPDTNVKAGVVMLSEAINIHSNGNMNLGLMVYNCGLGGAQNLWSQGIYTTVYTNIVMEKYYKYYAIIGE